METLKAFKGFFLKEKNQCSNNIKSNKVTINGVTYDIGNNCNNLQISGGKVIVNGKDITKSIQDKVINVTIEGGFTGNLDASGTIIVNGEVKGDINSTNGGINCGNVTGDIETTNGNVICGDVRGSIETINGNIKHR